MEGDFRGQEIRFWTQAGADCTYQLLHSLGIGDVVVPPWAGATSDSEKEDCRSIKWSGGVLPPEHMHHA